MVDGITVGTDVEKSVVGKKGCLEFGLIFYCLIKYGLLFCNLKSMQNSVNFNLQRGLKSIHLIIDRLFIIQRKPANGYPIDKPYYC